MRTNIEPAGARPDIGQCCRICDGEDLCRQWRFCRLGPPLVEPLSLCPGRKINHARTTHGSWQVRP